MRQLKADFHAHTADDPIDYISYSTEMLIDSVADLGFDIVTVSCHTRFLKSERLSKYAIERGVLLIPAIEQVVEGKHIVMLNPDEEQANARTFSELRNIGKRNAVFLAAHPFYPGYKCLGDQLLENIEIFDAIEFCNLYRKYLNFNRKADQIAGRFGLPRLGTSDCHTLPYCDSTYTVVYSEHNVDAVIEAIRDGRVEVKTKPRPFQYFINMCMFSVQQALRELNMISD